MKNMLFFLQEAVTDILEASLKSACRIYSEQKAIRVEKELQFQKLSRLEVNARSSKRLRVTSHFTLFSHLSNEDT